MNRFAGTAVVAAAGSDLEIHFENASLANQTVTIAISNGESIEDTVQIELDSSGKGATTWRIPESGWVTVILEHDTSDDHAIAVQSDQ